MERFLAKLERRYGHLPLPNLVHAMVGATAIVFVLMLTSQSMRPLMALMLDPGEIARGQVWRLITHALIPDRGGGGGIGVFWMFVWVSFMWMVGTGLEQEWGRFKANFFVLALLVATTVTGLLTGLPMTSFIISSALVIAFGTIFPDYQILLFFIVPLRMKWVAVLDAAYLAWMAWEGGLAFRATTGAALAVYVLFFYAAISRVLRGGAAMAQAAQRRAEIRAEGRAAVNERAKRQCAICGLTDDDENADLRVCTCEEVCHGKPTVYCLAHARSHRKPSA
jgi:hypothetical protein